MIEGNVENYGVNETGASALPSVSIYHFLHIQNLESIFGAGFLYSDAHVREQGLNPAVIGFSHVKNVRLSTVIPNSGGLMVGQCVPFYYNPRMPMLYVIFRADSPQLAYHDGEQPIVYLCFDVREVYEWAHRQGLRTFITDGNAAAAQTTSYADLSALQVLNWDAIRDNWNWGRDPLVKSQKQAEFLVEDRVDLALLKEIGVMDDAHRMQVGKILARYPAYAKTQVNVHRDWYF